MKSASNLILVLFALLSIGFTIVSMYFSFGISTASEFHWQPQEKKAVDTVSRFSSLPSGWNQAGFLLYEKTRTDLATSLVQNPNSIQSHRVLPLDHVKSTGNTAFWKLLGNGNGPPAWEPQTFINFFKHLSGCRYYIGFGTWIGPTLFYAAQLVDEAYGIEADPVAFAHVEVNLALNKDKAWASRIYLNHHAVGLGSEDWNETSTKLVMTSASAGNSCSGLGNKIACGSPKDVWQVSSYPLPFLLKRWNLPATNDLFIKVDVESFECNLLPSWLPWLRNIGRSKKPVFHIAFHSQIEKCSQNEYKEIYQFAVLFDIKNEACMDEGKLEWAGQGCYSGEFLFYDLP